MLCAPTQEGNGSMALVSTSAVRYHAAVTLAAVLLGVFAVAMSIAGTGVALPGIGSDLNTSGAALQWAITAYNLTLCAFTLVCGSLADLFGRRRLFLVTTVTFGSGSLVCAMAPNILVFDLARALAGIGAGGVMACGGALLAATFTGGARTRAFAAMGIGGGGVVLGPFLAGWLVTTLGWRASFAAFVVVAVLIVAASGFIAESRVADPPAVDWLGAVTFVLGLALLMYGLIQSPQGGSGGAAGIMAGLAFLVTFVVHERHRHDPVLDLSLARNAPFMGGAWPPCRPRSGSSAHSSTCRSFCRARTGCPPSSPAP
jgi:MFS family permease